MSVMVSSIPVNSSDGHRTEIRLPENPMPNAKGVLLFVPALGTRAAYYDPFIEAMAEASVLCLVPDLRGHGASSITPSRKQDFGYFEMLHLDLAAWVDWIQKHYPDDPLFLGGHSLGSQLTLLYSASNPQQVQGVLSIAAGTPYFKTFEPMSRRLALFSVHYLMPVFRLFPGYFPGKQIGFGGQEALGQMRDWSHLARFGEFKVPGMQEDPERLLRQLNKPVLSIAISQDDFAPEAAIAHLIGKLTQAQVQRLQLLQNQFPQRVNHNRWARYPGPIPERIVEWMQQQLPQQEGESSQQTG